MKAFVIFAAVIATVSANVAAPRASSGWGSGSIPTVNINLDAIVAAVGQGSASGSQQLAELAVGDSYNPAVLASSNGLVSSVSQDGIIEQVAVANPGEGTSSTINDGHAGNAAIALDTLEAYLAGSTYVGVQNSANTQSGGQGEIGSALNTYNELNPQSQGGSGWGLSNGK